MIFRSLLLVTLGLLIAAAPATQSVDPNAVVVRIAKSYKDGGGYNWKGNNTGTPDGITFKGERILRKGTGGTYCCGFTFAVVMRAASQLHLLNDKTPAQVKELQKCFYGIGDKEIQELQCVYGLEKLGIGHRVNADEAKAGDFCQLYREKSGHSVVFLNWETKDGRRVGLRYRSSQELTKGIGDRSEYFVDSGIKDAKVIRERVYFGRRNSPVTGEKK